MMENKRWNKEDISYFNFQVKDLEYLCGNGLEVGNFCVINIEQKFENDKGVILGYDGDVPIVCSENGDGVFSFEEGKKRFVNSSVEQFVLSINQFRKYCELVEDIEDEDEALAIVNSIINGMKKIDEHAWFKDANYWSIVGQQMIEGNL